MHAISRVLGEEGVFVWHKDTRLPPHTDAVIVPGGFSYGDYLRSGAIAAHSAIMDAVRAFAAEGGPVLGICNGFQILCEAGLLPGALARNDSLRFECRQVYVRVEGKPTPFTSAIPAGRVLRMPIAHGEGRYVCEDAAALARRGQVVFRYCDAAGGVSDASNPNGSQLGIAGVCSEVGNVVALMPHPERAAESVLGGESGRQVFESLRLSRKGRAA
jgi:phosphoribosylformylglycinamidine synthase